MRIVCVYQVAWSRNRPAASPASPASPALLLTTWPLTVTCEWLEIFTGAVQGAPCTRQAADIPGLGADSQAIRVSTKHFTSEISCHFMQFHAILCHFMFLFQAVNMVSCSKHSGLLLDIKEIVSTSDLCRFNAGDVPQWVSLCPGSRPCLHHRILASRQQHPSRQVTPETTHRATSLYSPERHKLDHDCTTKSRMFWFNILNHYEVLLQSTTLWKKVTIK